MPKRLPAVLSVLLFLVSMPPFLWASSLPGKDGKKNTQPNDIEPFKKTDRVLILAPHPDDEAIGCAGVIQQALAAGAQVKVVYLTNGDHNEFAFIVYEKRIPIRQGAFIHMGEVRQKEAKKAMALLGLGEDNLIFLGYPDWGTLAIFDQYWQSKKSFRDMLTRIQAVPYPENLSFRALYIGENILNDLKRVLIAYEPNKIFVSHPADVNRDHRALYLFLEVALRDLRKVVVSPKVYPYLIHWVGWPSPRDYHPRLDLTPPKEFSKSETNWSVLPLGHEQLDKKYRAILCYKSQTQSSAFYLLSFARKNELFGDFPQIELARQVSVRSRGESFFGFSGMFPGTNVGVLTGMERLPESKRKVSYAVVDDSFVIRVKKAKGLSRRMSLFLHIYGYSYKTPFAKMPKIQIITKHKKFRIFNKKKMIDPAGTSLELGPDMLILKIPLRLLGKPDFVLVSVKGYGEKLPVEAAGVRRIFIK